MDCPWSFVSSIHRSSAARRRFSVSSCSGNLARLRIWWGFVFRSYSSSFGIVGVQRTVCSGVSLPCA